MVRKIPNCHVKLVFSEQNWGSQARILHFAEHRQLITNKKLRRKMSKGIEQIIILRKAQNKLF